MIACIDTHYTEQGSRTALVLFERWSDGVAVRETIQESPLDSAEYVPGEFYRRELPCILSMVPTLPEEVQILVVDGYVWLDPHGRKGLGALLYESLDQRFSIVGVAKNRFQGSAGIEVLRGQSKKPLIVTAAGIDQAEAAQHIQSMHGQHRIPTMLKRVDHLARHAVKPEKR